MQRKRDAVLGLLAALTVLLGLLAVFAIELSNTQAKSKQDVEARVHERAVLAGALIDSLFQTSLQQIPQDSIKYGAPTVSAKTLDRIRGHNTYIALLNASGQVLAASHGFTAQARADLAISAALELVRAGHPYALGDVLPYGRTGVVNFAVAFPTRYGERILLTGFAPSALSGFLTADLHEVPGVKGAHNYIIDGRLQVLASTNPARPPGYVFTQPAQRAALSRTSGTRLGNYYDQVPLANSTWRIVLSAPTGPLFASVTGLHKWLPWLIFIAFAIVAAAALLLARRVLSSAAKLSEANVSLGLVNAELATTNEQLERTNAQLDGRAKELARSNAELEQFASIASHDLQEPLRKVRTFTQQISTTDADNLSDRGRDYLERANAAAARMQGLIDDLLKFSRVATHGHPFSEVNLGELTSEVLDDLESQVRRSGATVTVGELPVVTADALQMRQLIQNLISNALKFRRAGVAPEVTITGVSDGDHVTITVSDNGIGFEPQYSHRIFRVFERLHGRSEYPGTGIGLALCRKIAERHGGSIIADSALGEGATFTVTLPAEPQPDSILELDGALFEREATHAAV